MAYHYSEEEIQEIIEYAKLLGEGSFYDPQEGDLVQATRENVIRYLRARDIRQQIAAEREIEPFEVSRLQVERLILRIEAEEESQRSGGIESM